MRILMVLHAPPCPPELGPARRHYHELREFLTRGHQVSVLSYGTPAAGCAFQQEFGGSVESARFVPLHGSRPGKVVSRAVHLACGRSDFARLRTRRLQAALDDMVTAGRPDAVWCSTTMLGALRLPRAAALVGDTHNVEFDNLRRACEHTPPGLLREYFRLQSALTRREEIAWTRRFDVVCTTSLRDRDLLAAHVPGTPIEVVPNGVDLGAHTVREASGEPATVVFTGLMSYYPNAHGVRWFLDRVWPIVRGRCPAARLEVVGADPPRELERAAGAHVAVTGYVPDVRPYLERAAVYVIPLHIGGGTRVKALQAMAMGVPIVSTSLGVEGLDLESGEHALLADTPESFADALVSLVEQPVLGRRLARQAARHVQRFDWRRVGERLEQVVQQARRRALNREAVTGGMSHAVHSH